MSFWIFFVWALVSAANGAQYRVGQKFQIILSSVVKAPSNPSTKIVASDAEMFDVDMFETDASTIALLQAQGKIAICYFSAGTYEPYRPDSSSFTAADKGHNLPEWPDEYWLKVTNTNVRNIMTARIQLAASKGCDGIDPDNTDGYANPSGNMTVFQSQSVDYIHFLAGIASGLNMTIGLKNSLQILSNVSDVVSFTVNEQCGFYAECYWHKDFLAAGKPVYQIEYATPIPPSPAARPSSCAVSSSQPSGLSLVFKNLSLDGYSVYCDGSIVTTDTKPADNLPLPHTSTTTRPHPTSTTSKPPTSKPSTTTTTTTRTSSTSSKPSSPSSTAPSGCTSKHWDQCGGKDWKGCKICASPYTCKYSNDYYSQCL